MAHEHSLSKTIRANLSFLHLPSSQVAAAEVVLHSSRLGVPRKQDGNPRLKRRNVQDDDCVDTPLSCGDVDTRVLPNNAVVERSSEPQFGGRDNGNDTAMVEGATATIIQPARINTNRRSTRNARRRTAMAQSPAHPVA